MPDLPDLPTPLDPTTLGVWGPPLLESITLLNEATNDNTLAIDGLASSKADNTYVDDAVAGALLGQQDTWTTATTAPTDPDVLVWFKPRELVPTIEGDPNLRLAIYWDTALTLLATSAPVPSATGQAGIWAGNVTMAQSDTTKRPTVASVSLNGTRKVLNLDGTGTQHIDGAFPSTITGEETIFCVVKVAPAGIGRHVMTGTNNPGYRGFGVASTDKPVLIAGGATTGTPQSLPDTVTVTDTWRILAGVYFADGSVRFFNHKKSAPVTGTLTTDGNSHSSIRHGRNSGGSTTYSTFQVAADLVFGAALDDATVGAYMDQLAARYGLTPAA